MEGVTMQYNELYYTKVKTNITGNKNKQRHQKAILCKAQEKKSTIRIYDK